MQATSLSSQMAPFLTTNASTNLPKYFFSVREMRPSTGRIEGQPPKRQGGNIPATFNNRDVLRFFCDGSGMVPVESIPGTARLHRTHSVYYTTPRLFVTNYDAIDYAVGDGADLDTEGPDAPDSPCWTSWCNLYFCADGHSNYATMGGMYPKLPVQPVNHNWPHIILPAVYHAPTPTPASQEGGLNGELSLLIALIVLSIHPGRVSYDLPASLPQGRWFLQRRIHNREEGRGVVVSVYAHPEEDPAALTNYEGGQNGVLITG